MAITDYTDKAGQTGDGIIVGGATYAIATDWGSAGGTGFTRTHAQIVKVAWGDNYNTYRTTKINPFPVQLFDGNQGTTGALIDNNFGLKVTGDMRINQAVEIHGGKLDGILNPVVGGIIQIVGPTFGKSGPTAYGPGHTRDYHFNPVKATGSIQGFSAAFPVGVTFGGGQPGRGPGEGLIRRLYGGPIGYTGQTGYGLITHGARTNSSVLDRDIDTVAVQGLSGGFGVGVTSSRSSGFITRRLSFPYEHPARVSAEDSKTPKGDRVGVVGIKGATAIEVTGGIRIVAGPAGGSMEIRNLSAGRDNFAVWGADGLTAAHVKLFDSAGNPLGVSGDGALKVAIDNGVFTGTVTLSTNVYVTNATGGSLKVKGKTGDILVVKGPLSGGALEVASPSGLNIRSLTKSDVVGIGGDASENIGNIKSNVQITSGNISSIKTTVADDLTPLITSIEDGIRKWNALRGQNSPVHSQYDNDSEMFNTCVQRVYQPDELVALSVVVGSNAKPINADQPIYNGVYVSCDSSNDISGILVGNQSLRTNSGAGYKLLPGESIFLQVSNLNRIYARSIVGSATVRCIGS